METPGVKLVTLFPSEDWEITYHRLFDVSPGNAEQAIVIGAGVTIWDLCFREDLLQAINSTKRWLLDVGWYPHVDPAGQYGLSLIFAPDKHRFLPESSDWDWQNPVEKLGTRSLSELLAHIQRIICT